MKWFDGKINSVKNSLIPYVLHGINEEIYDEIVERSDGYYLIIRCGTMPFTNAHNLSTFKTDGETIIYPLPASEIKEIKLDWTPPTLFGDNSTVVINSGPVVPEFSGEVQTDRRYKEYRKHISGSNLEIDTTNVDFNRKAYIEEIVGTEEGLGDLLVDDEGRPILDEQGNEQYKIEIKNIGRNLLNFRNIKWGGNINNFSPSVLGENSVYIKIGNAVAGWRRIWFTVQGKPNTHYLFKAGNVVVNAGVAEMHINKEGFSGYDPERVLGTERNGYIAKNRTDETGKMRLELWLTGEASSEVDILYDKVMLIEGTSDAEFEPYKESVATLISPKKLLANEKLSWNSARERYEVVPIFEEFEPVKDGLIAWLDGRDGGYENYIWKDRSDNGNNIDMTSLKDYIDWDGSSYIIKPGSQNLFSSAIESTFQEGCTIEINVEADFGIGNATFIDGTYGIKTVFTPVSEENPSLGAGNLYLLSENGEDILIKDMISRGQYTITLTLNNSESKVYIDGVDAEIDNSSFMYTDNISLCLGSSLENKEHIKINSIKVYNKYLSSTEVYKNFNYEKSIKRDGRELPISDTSPILKGLICWFDGRDGKDGNNNWNDRLGKYNLNIGNDTFVDNAAVLSGGKSIANMTKNLESYTIEMYYKKMDTGYWSGLWGNTSGSTGVSFLNNTATSLTNYPTNITCTLSRNVTQEFIKLHFVFSENMFKIYENAKILYSGNLKFNPSVANNLLINSRKDDATSDSGLGSNGFKNAYRSIRMYNRALSEEEILSNYNFDLLIYTGSIASMTSIGNMTSIASIARYSTKKAELILFTDSNHIQGCTSGHGFTLDIPYKEVRYLEYPRDIVATVPENTDLVTLDWTSVVGATSYKILLDGEEYAQVSTNHWETREEIKGLLSVKAINDLTESKVSESIYVMSVPNETFISYFKNEYNNGYSFEVHFPDRSNIETSYKVYYKVDDRQEQCDELPASDIIGTVIKHKFTVPIVLDRIRIRAVAVNDTGENEVVPPTTLYITPTPIWTYKDDSKSVLLSWENRFENVTRYNLKIKVNDITQEEVNIETDDIEIGSKVSYIYPLKENDELKVSIAAVMNDIYHIYSGEITASKALDNTLTPPSDFRFRKITDTQIEFSWYDEHTCEEGFELTYSVSNKEPKTVFIPTLNVAGTGRKHSYIFNFEEHGFVTAKVRMKWELGVSRYTDELLVYYLPITGEAPSYLRRDVLDGNIRLEWEGQQYVDKYQVYKSVGTEGVDGSVEIIECTENNCNVYINYNYDKKQYNAHEIDNRWKVCKYSKEKYLENKNRGKHWIEELEPLIVDYKPSNATGLHFGWGSDFIAHAETYVYLENPAQISFNVFTDDEGCVFVNDKKVLETVSSSWDLLTANLNKGWNRIEILVHQSGGGHAINLSKAINSFFEISKISSAFSSKPMKVEFSVSTKFLDGTISEKSKPMIFYPQYQELDLNVEVKNPVKIVEDVNTGIYTGVSSEFNIESKSLSEDKIDYLVYQNTINKHLLSLNDISVTITGKDLETPYKIDTVLTNANSKQSEYKVDTISIKRILLDNLVHSTLYTKMQKEYLVHTETNKVRIMTIGDSITAGHPNFWAETMTGDEKSQYQYWLNRRLKNQYEIINKGYGSDTTDRMLDRFNKDVLGYNASYCIIQGGTNDLYWAMAEADGNQAALDMKLQVMKDNITEMVKRCWDNGIHPIVGTLIPRTGATGIYKQALYDFNEWIIMFCSTNENVDYIDFFNAGKDAYPPTPLEDPTNPGALNPIYDGDAIYDEFGNLIKQGRGIHPSVEGYKIMGECIPLNLFRTSEDGFKLYIDKECTIEEKYNDQDKLRPFYELSVDNIRRGNTKHIVRYLKNIGGTQSLFAVFATNEHSVKVNFLDEYGNKASYLNGLLAPGRSVAVDIEFNILNDDKESSVDLHIASRKLTTN